MASLSDVRVKSKISCQQYTINMMSGDDADPVFFKMACVVNIKLFFMDWFCYDLIILISNAKFHTKV